MRMNPKEIASLYNELRQLTEEVKNYYAFHAILTIMDFVIIFVLCVTSLTFNYTYKIQSMLLYNKLMFVYCILKLLFLFFIVRETHNTVQEVSDFVLLIYFNFNVFYIIKKHIYYVITLVNSMYYIF